MTVDEHMYIKGAMQNARDELAMCVARGQADASYVQHLTNAIQIFCRSENVRLCCPEIPRRASPIPAAAPDEVRQ